MQDSALTPYARALRHHRLLVLMTTIAALAGALAWLQTREASYKATAEVLVTPLPQGEDALLGLPLIRDAGDPTRTVQTAASLLRSPDAATRAAAILGRGATRASVQSAIDVKPQGASSIVGVIATANEPALAIRLANAYADGALASRKDLLRRQVSFALEQVRARRTGLGGSDPQLAIDLASRQNQLLSLRDGTDPTLAISSRADEAVQTGAAKWLLIALAVVAGFTLGLGTALALELLERRVRDEDELLRVLRAPILARVPNVPRRARERAGPLATPAVRESYRTVQIQLNQLPSGGHSILVTSATKGDGKTSSAINLAASLVGGGARVVLIDFDLRKPDAATRLRVDPEKDLVALLTGNADLEDILVAVPDLPALRIAPAQPGGTDAILLEALSRRLPSIIAQARALADYVVVDTPPLGEVGDALRVLPHVDEVVVIARPGHTDRKDLETVRDLLARAGRTPAGVILIGSQDEGSYGYGIEPAPRRLGRRSQPAGG